MYTKSQSKILPQIPSYLTLLITLLLITNIHTYEVVTTKRAPKTIVITKGSPRIQLLMGYENAFDVQIQSIENDGQESNFCTAATGEISPEVIWSGPIKLTNDQDFSYDNVAIYKGYTFVLDSISLNMVAIRNNLEIEPKSTIIKSDFTNKPAEKGEFLETWMTLDEQNGVLYILTNRDLLSYPLTPFFTALETHQRLPTIHNFAENFMRVGSIETMKYYQGNLYIIADNVVRVWLCAKNGDMAEVKIKFDKTFFKVDFFSAVDIAFKDNYAFILDSFKGVYVVDISRANQQLFSTSGLQIEVKQGKGQLIEVVKNSLNIITSSTKMTYLFEHIITTTPTLSFFFNRQVELYQSVTEILSDGNLLYILTGFFNLVARHSVPGEFNSEELQDYLFTYWPAYNIKSFYVSKSDPSKHQAVVVQDDRFTLYNFEQKQPSIICDTTELEEQEYVINVKIRQNTCHNKEIIPSTDIHTICEDMEEIHMLVVKDSKVVGDVSWSQTTAKGLMLGIVFLVLLVLIFCYLIRKYRTQYRILEGQIKFKKFKDADEPSGNEEVEQRI